MSITTGINCLTSRFNVGIEDCQPVEGLPTGFIAVPKGWKLNKSTDTFDLDYVNEQIQAGAFIPVVGSFEMISETPDATTQESQSGIMSVVRQGKPTFTGTYKKGLSYQRALYSLNSDNQWDFLITYETGYIKCSETVDGLYIKGFTGGMLNTNGYQENNGTTSAQSVVKFQLVDPLEYNQYVILLTQLNFNPNSLLGIIDVVISGTANVTGNNIIVKPVWLSNPAYPITGLQALNFQLQVNGVVNAIVGAIVYDSVLNTYTITPTETLVASDAVVVTLYDSVNSVPTAVVGSKFYKGAVSLVAA